MTARIIRVELPSQLRRLSGAGEVVDVHLPPDTPPTPAAVFDRLEDRWPVLRGTIRDHGSGARRAYIRWYADGVDISHEPPDTPLPDRVAAGEEVLRVLGAISGG